MRAEKCDFMRTETKYFVRVVSAEGIKPDPAAVSKIQEWMPPRNKEELQSFLGFANYYRDFIPFHAAQGATYAGAVKEESTLPVERKTSKSI